MKFNAFEITKQKDGGHGNVRLSYNAHVSNELFLHETEGAESLLIRLLPGEIDETIELLKRAKKFLQEK